MLMLWPWSLFTAGWSDTASVSEGPLLLLNSHPQCDLLSSVFAVDATELHWCLPLKFLRSRFTVLIYEAHRLRFDFLCYVVELSQSCLLMTMNGQRWRRCPAFTCWETDECVQVLMQINETSGASRLYVCGIIQVSPARYSKSIFTGKIFFLLRHLQSQRSRKCCRAGCIRQIMTPRHHNHTLPSRRRSAGNEISTWNMENTMDSEHIRCSSQAPFPLV